MFDFRLSRRAFCGAAVGAAVAPAVLPRSADAGPFTGRIYKAVKSTMVPRDMPLMDRFKMAKDVGFDGISLKGHLFDLKDVLKARDKVGLPIHNVNVHNHWQQRLSHPDPKVRAAGLENLITGLRFSHAVGGSSVLLVIGKVTDEQKENHEQVWQRSIEQIRKALPVASKLGVRILCENVRNDFCTSADEWARYLDEIGDPWVGSFFDIGNHQSLGGAHNWIGTLGTRIVKLDVKDHKSDIEKNCNLFEGDVDWPAVRKELKALRFTGWATAEVRGGDAERLRQVVENMDKALGI